MTNHEIEDACKKLIRGVFMRDTLPQKPLSKEIGIVNLDSVENKGTHWCLYYINDGKAFYFDSFGHGPTKEILDYCPPGVWASTYIMQDLGTKYCGHLCVLLAKSLHKTNDFIDSVWALNESL